MARGRPRCGGRSQRQRRQSECRLLHRILQQREHQLSLGGGVLSVVMRDSRGGGPYRVHIRVVSADDPGIADTSDPITTIAPAGLSAQ